MESKIEIELTEKEASHLRTLLEGGIKISDSISQGEVFKNILDHLNSQDQEEWEKEFELPDEIEQRIGKFVRDFSIAVQDEQSVNYNILRKMLRELLASEISKAKEPRLTQKEVSFINRLMVADRYGEDETIKTKNNTLNSEEWEALFVKLDKLTTK